MRHFEINLFRHKVNIVAGVWQESTENPLDLFDVHLPKTITNSNNMPIFKFEGEFTKKGTFKAEVEADTETEAIDKLALDYEEYVTDEDYTIDFFKYKIIN